MPTRSKGCMNGAWVAACRTLPETMTKETAVANQLMIIGLALVSSRQAFARSQSSDTKCVRLGGFIQSLSHISQVVAVRDNCHD